MTHYLWFSILLVGLQPGQAATVPRAKTQTSSNFQQVETLLLRGQWDEGIALLRPVLAQEAHSLQALNLMGIALTGKGDLPAANREYQRALKTRPTFVPALKNLAINELTLGRVDDAENHFRAALKLAPRDPVLHAYLGKIAFTKEQYQAAAQHLAQSGELVRDPSVGYELLESNLRLKKPEQAQAVVAKLNPNPMTPPWRFRIGLLLAQYALFQNALPFFERFDTGSPQFRDAAFNLAICQLETKQFSKALVTLRQLLEQGPKTAELDTLLAEALEGTHETQAAIDALREATQLAPEDESGFVSLTALCTKYEAYDVGMKVLASALQSHPNSDRLIFQRGVIYALTGQFPLAEQDFQMAARLAPEKNLSYAALGVNYLQAGDPEKAIASLRSRVAQTPDDATLQFLLGETLLRSGVSPESPEFAEARKALEQASRLDPQSANSRVELGKLYLKEDRIDDAVRTLEEARTLDSKSTAAYLQLVMAYRRAGKPDSAMAALARLNQLNEDESKRQPNRQRLRIHDADTSQDGAK